MYSFYRTRLSRFLAPGLIPALADYKACSCLQLLLFGLHWLSQALAASELRIRQRHCLVTHFSGYGSFRKLGLSLARARRFRRSPKELLFILECRFRDSGFRLVNLI